jgi:hypothetical protein
MNNPRNQAKLKNLCYPVFWFSHEGCVGLAPALSAIPQLSAGTKLRSCTAVACSPGTDLPERKYKRTVGVLVQSGIAHLDEAGLQPQRGKHIFHSRVHAGNCRIGAELYGASSTSGSDRFNPAAKKKYAAPLPSHRKPTVARLGIHRLDQGRQLAHGTPSVFSENKARGFFSP